MKKNNFINIAFTVVFIVTFTAMLGYRISHCLSVFTIPFQIKSDMLDIAHSFVEIKNSSVLSDEELKKTFSSSMYKVNRASDFHIAQLTEKQKSQLSKGEAVIDGSSAAYSIKCYFKSDDSYFSITTKYSSVILNSTSHRIVFSIFFVLAFTFAALATIYRSISDPLKNLKDATEQVSHGDFDVQIDVNSIAFTEIATLSESFNRMVCQLKNNEVLKNDFISNVSHEFKTPLATVNGFAKLLASGKCTPKESAEYSELIAEETNRLTSLCSNILKISKIENQKISPKSTTFLLDEQIRKIILSFENFWSEKNIELDIDLDETYFTGDEELLQHIWANLIENAVKFTPYGGKISIKLINQPYHIEFSVCDNGIGMSKETQKHIFDKFYQGDSAHSTQGNGLGLSLVTKILENCNGSINVKSALGKGSIFTVKIDKTNFEVIID